MTQAEVHAYHARKAAFAAKVDAFAATLSEEESAWLTGIVATAAGSDPAVNGYLFDINAGNPVINVNLNALTQTAIGVGNLGSVGNLGAIGQLGAARFRG